MGLKRMFSVSFGGAWSVLEADWCSISWDETKWRVEGVQSGRVKTTQ